MLLEALGARGIPVTGRKSCGLRSGTRAALRPLGRPWVPGGDKARASSSSAGTPALGLADHMASASGAGSGRLGRQWDLEALVARSKRSGARGGDRRRGGAGGPGEPRTRAGQDTGPSGAHAASLGILFSSSGCGA